MNTFDEAVPNLSELLAGQPVAPNYQQQPQEDSGVLGGARNWLQSNPAMSAMLLGTMMAAARGHNLGNAVSEGARFSLGAQMDQRERQEKDAERTRSQQMEDKKLGLEERRVAAQEKTANSTNEYYGAQTAETKRKTSESAKNEGLNRQRLEKQLAQIDEEIANSKDARKTSALQRKRAALQLKLDEEYAPEERGAQVTGMQLDNQGKVLRNEGAEAEAGMKKLNADEWAKAKPEERWAASYGKGTKAPATAKERFQQYIKNNGDLYVDMQGKLDFPRMQKDFEETEMYGDTAAQEAKAGEQRARIEAARNAVKPGQTYTVDGKTYLRRN